MKTFLILNYRGQEIGYAEGPSQTVAMERWYRVNAPMQGKVGKVIECSATEDACQAQAQK